MKPVFNCTLFLLLALFLSSCGKTKPAQESQAIQQPVIQQGIQGKASITLKQGQTNPLDGLEMILCRPEAERPILDIRNEKWLELSTPRTFGDGYENLDLPAIGKAALPFEVQRTKTDGFGRFTFADTPPGPYLLYAQYKSRYAAGYWLIPVRVEAKQVTPLEISNMNMKEIFNRHLN